MTVDRRDGEGTMDHAGGGTGEGGSRAYARVVHHAIRPADVLSQVGADEDGAVLLFLGTVRNHADGRAVEGLRYEAYEAMAREVLETILREVGEATGVDRLAAVHRVGELDIGEVSVAIAVSSPHRDAAYRASRSVIEEIKARLPVWKKEVYADGEREWVEGRTPRPRDGATGAEASERTPGPPPETADAAPAPRGTP